jgi:hypothetical protein
MSPLSFVQELVDDLIRTYPTLPAPPAHAQLSDLVIDCAGVFATILTLTEYELGGKNCGSVLMADITVVASRDCAHVSNDDGTTNWEKQDVVSAQMNMDSDLMWEWAEKQRVEAFAPTTPPSITYMNTGGVALTTLVLQLPVP